MRTTVFSRGPGSSRYSLNEFYELDNTARLGAKR